MQEWSDQARKQGKSIAYVPTMGFLHNGHFSLIREGFINADLVVVSIFVNPAQFAPGEDFESYPRNLERDLELIKKEEADIVFIPNKSELYPKQYQTYVNLEKLPNHLCGISRHTHFIGVSTIVTKLFNIVKPHIAVFGQKDYQQVSIIKQMVLDLNFDIKIICAPTVREPDGLAMSSRNTYLKINQRESALSLFKTLNESQLLLKQGIKSASEIINKANFFIKTFHETDIDYIKICNLETLDDVEIIDQPVLMALAVKVGKTRLIDNMILYP